MSFNNYEEFSKVILISNKLFLIWQGDENFGKVLAEYIGTAVDGLSGGGGAVNFKYNKISIIRI